jgi:hypothetical protein
MESLAQISYLPLFHVKRDAFGSRIEKHICEEIMNTEEVKKFIKESTDALEAEVYSRIGPMITAKAENRANHCLGKIPWKWEKTKATVRIPRKLCLSTGWEDIEAETVSEVLAMPKSKRFNISGEDVKHRVNSYKNDIKEKVEGAFF